MQSCVRFLCVLVRLLCVRFLCVRVLVCACASSVCACACSCACVCATFSYVGVHRNDGIIIRQQVAHIELVAHENDEHERGSERSRGLCCRSLSLHVCTCVCMCCVHVLCACVCMYVSVSFSLCVCVLVGLLIARVCDGGGSLLC